MVLLHPVDKHGKCGRRAAFASSKRCLVIESDPHTGTDFGCIPNEPCISGIICGSGFSGDGAGEYACASGGAFLHDILEHARHQKGDTGRNGASWVG